MSESRINNTVTSGSIKQLLFMPSGRQLWIVVGKGSEYWTDSDLKFCSCKDFYFTALSDGSGCYHLESVRKAIEDNKHVIIRFNDSEYVQILQAIADDNMNLLSRS